MHDECTTNAQRCNTTNLLLMLLSCDARCEDRCEGGREGGRGQGGRGHLPSRTNVVEVAPRCCGNCCRRCLASPPSRRQVSSVDAL